VVMLEKNQDNNSYFYVTDLFSHWLCDSCLKWHRDNYDSVKLTHVVDGETYALSADSDYADLKLNTTRVIRKCLN